MGIIRKDFKFKKVENFLTKEETNLLKKYSVIKHRTNTTSFDYSSDTADTMFYADPIMESLMLTKKEIMEKETGLELLPTYAFWRMYSNLAELRKHKDRPACEISSTLFFGGDKWPIFVDGKKVDLKESDFLIYRGFDLPHWREEFKGRKCVQAFMHWNDINGPYGIKNRFDGRPCLGYPEGNPIR